MHLQRKCYCNMHHKLLTNANCTWLFQEKKLHRVCSPPNTVFKIIKQNNPPKWLANTGSGSCQNLLVCALRCSMPLSSSTYLSTMHPSGINHTWAGKYKNGEPTQSGFWMWAINRNNLWAGIFHLSEQIGNELQTNFIGIIFSVAFRFGGLQGWGPQRIF